MSAGMGVSMSAATWFAARLEFFLNGVLQQKPDDDWVISSMPMRLAADLGWKKTTIRLYPAEISDWPFNTLCDGIE